MLRTLAEASGLPESHRLAAPQAIRRSAVAWLVRVLAAIRLARERSRQRHALAELNDWQLEDIGLSRAEARQESAKPFWKV